MLPRRLDQKSQLILAAGGAAALTAYAIVASMPTEYKICTTLSGEGNKLEVLTLATKPCVPLNIKELKYNPLKL